MNNFSRVTGAFLLTVSLLGSTTISLAQTTTVINPSQDQKTTTHLGKNCRGKFRRNSLDRTTPKIKIKQPSDSR